MPRRRDNDKTQQQLKKELTELRRRIVELERLESVPAKEALRGSEEELKTILDEIKHGIILLDLTGKIISINKRITEISGYTEKDVVGQRFNRLKMFPPQDLTALLTAFAQVISGKTLTVEVEAYAKTGEKLIVEFDGTLLRIGGKTERVIVFLKDISARRQAEEALRESEEEFEAIFDEVRDGIVLLDLTGKIIKINKRITDVTGYTEKYIVGKRFNFFKNFPPLSIAKMTTAFIKAAAGKRVTPFEVIGYTKTGEKRIGEVYGSLVKKKGKAVGVLVVMTDITERKQAEEAQRESENRYRTLIDNVDLGITLMDVSHNIIMVNAAQSAKFNKSAREIIGKKCFREFEKRDAVCPYCPGVQTMATGQPAKVETEGVRDDGSRFHVRLKTFPILDQDGTAIGFIETAVDISKRKQAEEALRASEQKYRTILETTEEGYAEVDLAGNFTFFNDALCRIHGRTREEMRGLHNRTYMTSETAQRIYAIFNKVYRTGIPAKIVDNEIIRKDGSIALVEESVSLLRNAAGEAIGFYGVSRDRTEQKQAEMALRVSEEKYRSILSTMKEGYYEVDLRGNITFCNDAACRNHRRSREELLGMNNREYMTPKNATKIYEIFNKVYRTGIPAQFVDNEIIRKDGTVAMLEESVSLLRNAAGEAIGFYGVSRDRTEQKQAEEALRQSEERYRTIIENIEDGYYEVDLAGNFTFVNDATCKIQGYTRDQMIGMNNREYMDKKTAKKVYKIFNTVLRTGKSTTISNWQIIRKDGAKRDVESSVSLIRDVNGRPRGFRGIIRDITARKQAEEELQYRATHDLLTDLPNRLLFSDRLSIALTQAQRNQKKLAVMLLDLDYFKDVNDTMGHSAGDRLLRVVGNRLKELLRGGDTVARVGGDEFLLLLSEIGGIEDANTIAQKILEAFRKPFILDDHEIMLTTSIGISIFPDDSDNADSLVKYADVAMYRAKDKGRDNLQRYTPA